MDSSAATVEGHYGKEPLWDENQALDENALKIKITKALGWYSQLKDLSHAKKYLIEYVKHYNGSKLSLEALGACPENQIFTSAAWLARMDLRGAKLPAVWDAKITKAINQAIDNGQSYQAQQEEKAKASPNKLTVQDYIKEKAGNYIGELEEILDKFFTNKFKSDFDPIEYFAKNAISGVIANHLAQWFKTKHLHFVELALNGDEYYTEVYSQYSTKKLQAYAEFIEKIIDACSHQKAKVKAERKPRKTKEKLPAKVVGSLKYCKSDAALKVVSISPAKIVGAEQLWSYNLKYKTLTVFNAAGASGLSVKGTTIVGYDPKTSVTKTLRKPAEKLKKLVNAGKVPLRKFMEELTTKDKPATGRCGADTILVRVG